MMKTTRLTKLWQKPKSIYSKLFFQLETLESKCRHSHQNFCIAEASEFINFDLEIMQNMYPSMYFSLNSWSVPFLFKYSLCYLVFSSLTEGQSHFAESFLLAKSFY